MTDASISIGIDSRKAKTGAAEVRRSLDDIKRSGRDAEGSFDRVAKSSDGMSSAFSRVKVAAVAMTTALAGIGLVSLARGFLNAARETENLGVRLKYLTGSAEGAAVAFKEIKEFASTVPFTFQEIQNSSGSLLVAARNSEEFSKLLRITGDIAASTGLTFGQTAEQLQRAFSGGMAAADMFREKGVAALLGFQQGATVSAEETRKKIFGLWDDVNFKLKGASQDMADTWDGTMSMLSDKWFQFQLAVTGSALFDTLKAAFAEIDRQAGEAGSTIESFGERIGIGLAQGLQAVVAFGSDLIQTVGPIVDGAWGVVTSLWDAWKSFADGVGVSPSVGMVGLLLFGRAGLIFGTVVSVMTKVTGYLEEQLANFSNYIRGLYNDTVSFLGIGSQVDLIDVNQQRKERQARLDSFREQAKAMSGAVDGKTGAAASAQKIADAMQKAIDKFKEGKKSAQELAKTLVDFGGSAEKATDAFEKFTRQMEADNKALKANIEGKKEQVPLIEAEAKLRESMGRDLLPKERAELEKLIDENTRLNKTWDEQQKQVKEVERIWTNAADNIQNALADSIFAGKDLFESLKDTALSVAKQIAAAMIFQPIISPIIGSVSGGMAGTPMSGGLLGNLGGGSGGMFSGLSSVWDMLNGPSTIGNSFVTGSIGQMLGLSTPAASGIGPVAVSGLGQSLAGIGNFLGAGGMGYGVGSLVGALGIGNSTGASIGGALGGAVGSIIPGVGTIIGSVAGSLIGSLFGNNQPSDKFAQTYIGLRSGQTSQAFNPSEFSQQNLDASQALITQVQSLTDQITSLTGGTLPEAAFAKVGSRDGIVVGVGSSGINVNNRGAGITQSFENSEQGAQNALDFLATAISRRVSGVSDPMYRQVLALGGTASEISSNLQFVEQIKQLAEGGKTQTLADSLQAVNVKYAEAITRAKSLGLSINEIVTAREREKQAIKDQVQAQRDSFGLNLDYRSAQLAGNDRLALEIQLEEQRKQQIANAQSLLDQQIITQTQFQRLSDILDQEVIKSLQSFDDQLNQSATQLATSALSNLQQFATGLATSDLSPLNAQQQGAYAQTEFSRLAGLAQGGDITAINQLSGAAQTYLQTQRTLYGSGTQFVDAFNAVTSVLSQIANTDTNTLIEQAITVETRNQTETLAAKLDEVKSVLQSILNQNQTASNKPAQAA